MKQAVALALIWAGVLCGASKLSFDRLALHRFEDGPLLEPGYEFLPGELAYFSCRLAGYAVEQQGEDVRKVKISWNMEVRDPEDALLEAPSQGRIEASLFPEDKTWMPKFLHSFTVPAFALPGDYRVVVHARDEIGENDVTGELKFRVKGHAVQASETLAVRNFLFLASEDDAFGMRQPLYKAGAKVWARMDVTGYKFAAKNHFAIAFGLALDGPDGQQIFAQPDAGMQSDESFYPQRYAPGMFRVDLGKAAAPGTYTLIITVRDTISGESIEAREPFKVE